MCSGRVFMVMELSGNQGGKKSNFEGGGDGWLAGWRGREDDREENTTGRRTEEWNKQDEATRSNKSQPFYDRAGKSRRFLHFGAPRSAKGFVLEISDGKSLRGSL